jgi:quercetin dioxygenase-like cupin family protein
VNKAIASGVVLGAALVAFASQAQAQGQAQGQAKRAGAVFQPSSDLKWTDVPNFQGVKMAVVEGDPAKGPAHFFIKFEPGFTAPRHHHTADHHATVVAGTLVLTVDDGERRLPPGSFFTFTGKAKHATKCEPGAECVLLIDARGKWDVLVEGAGKAEKRGTREARP